jgi:hypothetical protein
MRWSLILSTFIAAQSAVSFAAVLPSSDQLQRRAVGAKVSSKTYRKASEESKYAYKFDQTGGVTREKLKPADRLPNNKKTLMIPKTDADHVFEHQMLNNHLKTQNLEFEKLHPDLQKKVKGIINGPGNMAPVPAGVNRGKGQVVKQGMDGKAVAPKKDRDAYTKLSYGTARKTAKELDKAFKDGGHGFGKNTLHSKLRNTMNNAKIMKPGDASPASSKASSAGSSAGSTKGTPKRPGRTFPVGKSSPLKGKAPSKAPARKSSRIAAQPKKNYKV